MCCFDGIQRSNYFGGEPIGRAEVDGKAAEKDGIIGEMIKRWR